LSSYGLDNVSSVWLDKDMNLLTYISDMQRRTELAKACSTSPDYLWQIATNWRGRKPSARMAALIESATERLGPRKVPKELLIWPELAVHTDKEPANSPPLPSLPAPTFSSSGRGALSQRTALEAAA